MGLYVKKTYLIIFILLLGFSLGGCRRTQVKSSDSLEPGDLSQTELFLFADSFQNKDLSGWTKTGGSWRAKNGVLQSTGRDQSKLGEGFHFLTVSDLSTDHYRIEVDVRFLPHQSQESFTGIIFRFQDESNFYAFRLSNFDNYQDCVEFYEFYHGNRSIGQHRVKTTFNPDQWYHIEVEVEDFFIQAYLDGHLVLDLENDHLKSGTAGLFTKQAKVEFRNFKVLPL